MKTSSIARHFSRAAPYYDREARLQAGVAERLVSFLGPLKENARILDVGCGTGFLTRSLAQAFPTAKIHAIDISEDMILVAGEHAGLTSSVSFQAADAFCFHSATHYDVIVSSSAFQWMQPLSKLFTALGRVLNPQGELCFSLMTEGTLSELRQIRQEIAPDAVSGQSLPNAKAVKMTLEACGYEVLASNTEVLVEYFEDARVFLATIKRLGFTGGSLSRGARPLRRREIEQIVSLYERRFSATPEGVKATYKVDYLKARRAC